MYRSAEARASPAWWVFIPPQASRPAAFGKAIELKDLGVEDYFVVQDEGEHRWALSLGIFRTEEAAQARLSALQEKGCRPRASVRVTLWCRGPGSGSRASTPRCG